MAEHPPLVPLNRELLKQQDDHRSRVILEGGQLPALRCRTHAVARKGFAVSDRVVDFLRGTQFYFIHRVVNITLNVDLITALIERWRPETHTFHLPVGEATVTLQDVQVLLGLRIRGDVVSGPTAYCWSLLISELLGKTPTPADLVGASLKIKWLLDNFSGLPVDANDEVLHQYVRAYVLILMATIMFPDKSGNDIQVHYLPLLRDLGNLDGYSWGSAVLATLYRNLCRGSLIKGTNIRGPLILLQLWAWERMPIGRPQVIGPIAPTTSHGPYPLGTQHEVGLDSLGRRWLDVYRKRPEGITTLLGYREAIDTMRPGQFLWQPYTPQILSFLPDFCYDDREDWIVVAPMICFDIVEWHFPNRVVRQFGLKQEIPDNCDTNLQLHKVDKRGASTKNWVEKHAPYITMWVRRSVFRFHGVEEPNEMSYYDPYLVWYRERAILYFNPYNAQAQYHQQPFGATHYLAQGFVNVHNTCDNELRQMPPEVPPHFRSMVSNLRDSSSQHLQQVGYDHLLQPPPQEPKNATEHDSAMDDDVPLSYYTRRGRPSTSSNESIQERFTPEPSRGKQLWTRLLGKKSKSKKK